MEELLMNSFLQKKFPLIRTREEILSEIAENERLKEIYGRWKEEQRVFIIRNNAAIPG